MLGTAVRDGLVPVNVCERVNRPTPGTEEAEYLSAGQLRAVLDGLRGHRVYPLVLLLATSGLRIGEGLALRWRDVDLAEGMLRVTGTLSGIRRLCSADRSQEPALPPHPAALARRRGRAVLVARGPGRGPAARRHRSGMAASVTWIFTTASGHVLDQRNAQRQYARALAEAGLDVPARFHMLRHTLASLMLGDAQVPRARRLRRSSATAVRASPRTRTPT